MFLGHAKGRVGSVVFYRASGKQLARAKAETVKNPKTTKQVVQRAIMATVMQAYSQGKAIFDHSFQGKSVPGGSMNRFNKVNADLLRTLVVSELNAGTSAADGVVALVQKGATCTTPNSFRISEGSLVQSLFTVAPSTTQADVLTAALPDAGTATTVAEYCAANGLVAGDIYTIVCFGIAGVSSWQRDAAAVKLATHYPTQFGFIRLIVKASAITSDTAIGSATFGDLFTIDAAGTQLAATTPITTKLSIMNVIPNSVTGSMGVIRSREDSGLRSTTDMVIPAQMNWGIKAYHIVDAWTAESSIAAGSDLILEGGDI